MWVRLPSGVPYKKDNPRGTVFLKSAVNQTTDYNLTIIKIFVKSNLICYNLTMKTLTTRQFDEVLKLTLESVKASDQTTVLKRNGCYNGKKIRSRKTANTLVKHNDTSH